MSGEQQGASLGHHAAQQERVAPLWKAAWAVALTGVAGWVDCGGYLWVAHILTANQSGNTVEIAVHLFAGTRFAVLLRAAALASFFVGLLACALIHDWMDRRRMKSTASATFFLEALLLGVATMLLAMPHPLALLVSLGLAMGLQNATLTRIGALSVRTTHVTGTISELADSAAAYWFWARGQTLTSILNESSRQKHFRSALVTFSLWLAFLSGAAAFMAAQVVLDRFALLPAVAVLLGAVLFDLYRPMRRQEEKKDLFA